MKQDVRVLMLNKWNLTLCSCVKHYDLSQFLTVQTVKRTKSSPN